MSSGTSFFLDRGHDVRSRRLVLGVMGGLGGITLPVQQPSVRKKYLV